MAASSPSSRTSSRSRPPPGFTLAPGADWVVDFDNLAHPIRHWTDGATTGFLILADGSTRSLRTVPTTLYTMETPPKRGTVRFPVPAQPPVPVSIIPWPLSVDVNGRRTAPSGLAPKGAGGTDAEAAVDGFEQLSSILFPGEGLCRPEREGGYPVELVPGSGGKEGYAIDFSPDGARVTAETRTGFFYGLVTLGQMLRGARGKLLEFSFPTAGRIEDAPTYGWRGCHLDVARRFYSSADVTRFVALLAWNKLNVLHWHLSDDEAWRVEIDAYPELTRKAAWNGYGLAIPPLLGSGPERTGGYYAKADIRQIVAVAELFGVDVVPEIDVPGHCYALLQAVPQLRDPGENGLYHSIQGFPEQLPQPGGRGDLRRRSRRSSARWSDLFPSRYFHVGADEVPHDAWETLTGRPRPRRAAWRRRYRSAAGPFPAARAGVPDRQGQDHRRLGGGLAGRRHRQGQAATSSAGRIPRSARSSPPRATTSSSPRRRPTISTWRNGEEFAESGAAWAGLSSLENTYAFEPAAGWSEAETAHLMGIQGCIWNEPMTDRAVFDRLVFPRLSAIAETGWSTNRDFARFTALVGLMPNMYGNYEDT